MKKFIKKRRASAERRVDFRVGSPAYMESSSGIESDFMEYAAHPGPGRFQDSQSTAPIALENEKFKASIRRLVQENARLKDQLDNRDLVQTYEEADVAEIRSLAEKLVNENQQLNAQVSQSQSETRMMERSLNGQLEGLMDQMDELEDINQRSDGQFQQLLLEHETLQKTLKEKDDGMAEYILLKDHKATISGLKGLLQKLKQQYSLQTKGLQVQLLKSEKERKRLVAETSSLRLTNSEQLAKNEKNSLKLKSMTAENRKLQADVQKYRDETATLQRALDDLLSMAERSIQDNASYKSAVQNELEKMNDQLQKVHFVNDPDI